MNDIYIKMPDDYGNLLEGNMYSVDDLLEEIERLEDLVYKIQTEFQDYVDYIETKGCENYDH